MDTLLENFPGSLDGFRFENGHISKFPNQNPMNGFTGDDQADASSFPTNSEFHSETGHSSITSTNEESSDSNKYSNPALRFISDILLDEEDDLERKPCMLQDCLALRAAEKSFYDALGRSYPSSPRQFSNCIDGGNADSPDDPNFFPTHSFESCSSHTTDNTSDSDWVNSVVNSPEDILDFSDLPPDLYGGTLDRSNLQLNLGDSVRNSGSRGTREKRIHWMGDSINEEEGRGSKLSAVSLNDSEPTEMFDEVLLCNHRTDQSPSCGSEPSQNGTFHLNIDSGGSNGKATRSKKGSNKGTSVDLWTLLTQCAQAVASFDQRNANELLKQIRQHCSPFGDGLERLAYYFAKGLETRLAAGTPSYNPNDTGATAAEMLKAYKLYITASPFLRISNFLANRSILKLVGDESSLHIIDFGICYGFQWPCLIQRLSERQGGPPKLRITGIEFPQSGFRPAGRIEETGRRLANYCRRFNIPFEYNCFAQNWETIQLEDLKINRNEVTVVNCLYRLKNVPDETVSVNCPRDAVLKLIRKINPNMFIHGVVNGTYNAPFFATRFREALFHYSSLFDMFEANVPREDPERLWFEKGIFGRDAMNVIACEGAERVERPETYKQWQVRNRRAGFKQLRIDAQIFNKAHEMVKTEYHKDFDVDEDGRWVLMGWKGRIIHALSIWKPA
ncbi:hypothetical protein K1719_036229 [Acacia pycnantha]|nr:hypothetical protein K1719_036229 [Acacia pycnantha]